MQLTKSQKTLHVIFRILVFLSLGAAVCEFFMFVSMGIAGSSSVYSYSSTLGIATGMCYMYYILLAMGMLAVAFSLICCRCTTVAATVTRTIFLALAVGLNFTSFPAYETIRRFAGAYMSGDYYSVLREYRGYASSDDFEIAIAVALVFVMMSIVIYFVLSVTSIVALAKKPAVYNQQAYNQYYQQLYGRGYYNANGQWVNPKQMNPYYNNGQWNGNPNAQMNNGQWNGNPNAQMNNGQWNGNPNAQMNNGQWNGNPNAQMNNNQWNGNPYPQPQEEPIQETVQSDAPVQEAPPADIFDENGVKQSADGRKILRYDTMTGEPVYADEEQEQTENHED